jgi:hypothetical protein
MITALMSTLITALMTPMIIDDAIVRYIHQVISFEMNAILDGNYEDKLCAWKFRSIICMDCKLFFGFIPGVAIGVNRDFLGVARRRWHR